MFLLIPGVGPIFFIFMSTIALAKVVIAGLVPAIVIAIAMFAVHNVFVAMFLMHWVGMVVVAAIVTIHDKGVNGILWYSKYLGIQELLPIKGACAIYFTLGTVIPIVSYMIISCRTINWGMCIGPVTENIAEYGFRDAPLWLVVCCAIYFPTVNPFIEEMFWRVFMNHEVSPLESEPASNEESAILGDGEASPSTMASTASVEKLPHLEPLSLLNRVLFSALYASYHTMVVGVFLGGFRFGILAFFLLVALGMVFQHIFAINSVSRGFYQAVSLHVGVDLGAMIALGDAMGWYTLM